MQGDDDAFNDDARTSESGRERVVKRCLCVVLVDVVVKRLRVRKDMQTFERKRERERKEERVVERPLLPAACCRELNFEWKNPRRRPSSQQQQLSLKKCASREKARERERHRGHRETQQRKGFWTGPRVIR
jgi:hypothetical protein